MKDRYIYRAKRKSDKKWIYGNLIQTDDGVYIIQNYVPQHLIGKYEVDPSTICQCTGLRDKNGKLICENDIVNVSTNKGNTLCEVRYAGIVAHFQLWQFKTIPKTSTVLNLGNYEEQVIGNRFDNPELLEK